MNWSAIPRPTQALLYPLMDQLPPFVVDHSWVPDSPSLSRAACGLIACTRRHVKFTRLHDFQYQVRLTR